MLFKDTRFPIAGGVLAAMGASLCCVGPLILLLLGISGSWISHLTLLEPYRPIFIALVMVLFGIAAWKLYQPLESCEPGTACAVSEVRQRQRIIFWIAAGIALLFLTSSYWLG